MVQRTFCPQPHEIVANCLLQFVLAKYLRTHQAPNENIIQLANLCGRAKENMKCPKFPSSKNVCVCVCVCWVYEQLRIGIGRLPCLSLWSRLSHKLCSPATAWGGAPFGGTEILNVISGQCSLLDIFFMHPEKWENYGTNMIFLLEIVQCKRSLLDPNKRIQDSSHFGSCLEIIRFFSISFCAATLLLVEHLNLESVAICMWRSRDANAPATFPEHLAQLGLSVANPRVLAIGCIIIGRSA